MEINYIKIAETFAIILIYFLLRNFTNRVIERTKNEKLIQPVRSLIVKRAIGLFLLIVSLIIISLIWGVDENELFVFVGSALTVVGVALFAQWSILSNITASIIIFFNHHVKLGDEVRILEGKDYVIEGKVKDLGLFFISLETKEGEEITIPNNVFISKSIQSKSTPQ
ncbi:mechanosensitive ion channel domain-containing protein [Algoriphagus sediminis]|uniref:Mechanosensitive ion channel n=1 Tax=Algoriphagus sediminis TaxID=3057113 RepID=A0ABT7YFP9_9BACT|nr:mechanosensitive ion channel domain-containing protein [Algoriphagus sediminis]MDN3205345.1 mechanosensitive ion channel [Algoriphagus sediminis]